ncbi:uncharacterized protein LOC124265353 [Haliotis rubra]|uniref:uncharacterized protein LOC124265353 n=1 Tax=Haliotis rubra TaxID=36100 RepID=UPI001EE50E1C|nr:uncharacterized protein LOC124265353 [Haliotis rubra]
MKMWLYSRCVPCILLAILVPSASETIPDKIATLLGYLRDIDTEVGGVLGITDDQCPCLENVTLIGNETFDDVECFETKVEVFRNNLNALITFVESLDSNTTRTCPERTGSIFVAACDSPTIAEVDPNGFIQNGFQLASNVTGWTLGPFDNDSFEFDYFGSEPFVLRCLSLPTGMEVVLGNSTDDPLSMTAEGTGIAYFEPTNELYVALTFDNSSFNGVYGFNRTNYPQIRFLFPYDDGTPGRLYVSGKYVYNVHNEANT